MHFLPELDFLLLSFTHPNHGCRGEEGIVVRRQGDVTLISRQLNQSLLLTEVVF